MTKELKFRVWSGEAMISPDYIDRQGFAHWKEDSIPRMSKDVMQYTGLKDKKGKDVFEGDVLQEESGRKNKHKVFAVEGGFAINTFQGDLSKNEVIFYESTADTQTSGYISGQCKIIGNIHANPELVSNG